MLALRTCVTTTLAVLALAQSAPSQKQEVVDTFTNGAVRARYTIDATGRRVGAYIRYHRNGKARVRAIYAKGRKQGAYQEYFRDGSRKITSTYKNDLRNGEHREYSKDGKHVLTAHYQAGKKHGAFSVQDSGKTLTKQEWRAGELVTLNGHAPFPRTAGAIRTTLATILQAPETVPGSDADPLLPKRLAALRRLQAYRYLCGLPYADMQLHPEWNTLCDFAARLCRRIRRLDHTPERPAGMDAESYRQGYQGTSHSNLSRGSGMVRSVDSYMNDSDPSNIDRVGHRRWCLNPTMARTGFGEAGQFSAMWSFDRSGSGVSGLAAVFYPPRGRVPVGFFGPRHAWSISIVRGRQAKTADVRITVTALDNQFLPTGKPLELDHLATTSGGAGIKNCVIFRPVGVAVKAGSRYWCEVSLDGGASLAYQYLVEFIE